MKPRVGISSCLLGQPVRHDGGHKRAPSLLDALDAVVEWIAVCPELDIGLGVPRPPIDLYETGAGLRLIMPSTNRDLTDLMRSYAVRKVEALQALGVSGYVFKAKSPSCGVASTRVHDDEGAVIRRDGTGAFAEVLRRAMPDLPIAEETELNDTAAAERFLARVRAYRSGRNG